MQFLQLQEVESLRSPVTTVTSQEQPWQVIYDQRGSQRVNISKTIKIPDTTTNTETRKNHTKDRGHLKPSTTYKADPWDQITVEHPAGNRVKQSRVTRRQEKELAH